MVFFFVFSGARDSLPLVRIFTRSIWARGVRSHRLGGWDCASASQETIAPTDQFKPVPPKYTNPIHSNLTNIRFTQVLALQLPMGSPQKPPGRSAPGENGSKIIACQNRHPHRSASHCRNSSKCSKPADSTRHKAFSRVPPDRCLLRCLLP